MKRKLTKIMIKQRNRIKRVKLLTNRNYKKLNELSTRIIESGKADFLGYDNSEKEANLRILLRGERNKLHYKTFSKRLRIVKKQLKNDNLNLQWRIARTKGYRRSKNIDPNLSPEEIVKGINFIESDEDFYLNNRDIIMDYNKEYRKIKRSKPNIGHDEIKEKISYKTKNNLLDAYKINSRRKSDVFFKQHQHLLNKNEK